MAESLFPPERRAAAKVLCDAAAPPPWKVGDEVGGHVSEVIAPCQCCGRIAVCDQFGPSEDRSCYHSEFIAAARTDLPAALAELDRLSRGDWTADEFQAICHNLHGTVDARAFADGCSAEQRKLYGCAPDSDEVTRLRAQVAKLEAQVKRQQREINSLSDTGHFRIGGFS